MKIAIISDVHIGNYPNYESYPYERLNWYPNFAHEVVDKCRKSGITHLFIAGDLSDRSTNTPQIQNVIRTVLNIFESYFTKVFYINGQHDLRTRDYDNVDNNTQSCLHAMAPNQFIYGDHAVINVGGRKVAMMDFNPEPDLSWISGKVDLFIGHVTINTSGFGSEIDYSKFTLGIVGDIHYPCHKKNLHSVGVAVPRYLGDAKDGTWVICDLDDLSFDRITVDPDHNWLTRYVATDDWDKEGPSDAKLPNGISPKYYYIYHPTDHELSSDSPVINFDDSRVSDINEIINKVVEDNDLGEIHGRVLNANTVSKSIDLNFRINYLTIHNVRSIDDHTIKFRDRSGVLQIISENGGGKSTIIWSLNYALRGGLDIKSEIREGCEDASVYLELEYQGKTFGIYRGTDGVSLDIDHKYQDLGGKRDTERSIIEYLPFINYLDSYFFTDDSTRILGSYSADRRIELLSTYYRLDILDTYHDTAESFAQNEWEKYNSLEQAKNDLENKINESNLKISQIEDELKELPTREVLEDSIKTLESTYKDLVIKESKIEKFDLNSATAKYNSLTNSINARNTAIKILEKKLASKKGELNGLKVGVQHSTQELMDMYAALTTISNKMERLEKDLDLKKTILDQFDAQNKISCPKCNEVIHLAGLTPITKESLSTEIKLIEVEINNLEDDYDNQNALYRFKYVEHEDYKKYQEAKRVVDGIQANIDLNKSNLSKEESDRDELAEKIEIYKQIKSEMTSDEVKEELDHCRAEINKIESLQKSLKDLQSNNYQKDLDVATEQFNSQLQLCQSYDKYLKLFGHDGDLFRIVLNAIVNRFNSSSFKYEVVSTTYRGKVFNDIVGYYKNYKMQDFREYSHCSNGQRTLLDLDFLRNLVTKAGIIVFDDFLGYLTTENLLEGLRIISSMNPPLKILTSQNESTTYVDDTIVLEYNGDVTEFVKE